MKVKVQFFGEFRRLTHTDGIELEMTAPASVGDVVEAARARFPVLRRYDRTTLTAKGVEFARPSEPVSDGDEISLMPPVTGG